MGLLNKLFGYRWSLYITKNDNEVVYVMHENSVIRILGYVMDNFSCGKKPIPPWGLYLNFNKTNKNLKLTSDLFTDSNSDVDSIMGINHVDFTDKIIKTISDIDPHYQVKGATPILMHVPTKKKMSLSFHTKGNSDDLTLHDVMEMVFGGNQFP